MKNVSNAVLPYNNNNNNKKWIYLVFAQNPSVASARHF